MQRFHSLHSKKKGEVNIRDACDGVKIHGKPSHVCICIRDLCVLQSAKSCCMLFPTPIISFHFVEVSAHHVVNLPLQILNPNLPRYLTSHEGFGPALAAATSNFD